MNSHYVPAIGSHITRSNAVRYGQQIERLVDDTGSCEPAVVVEAARPPDSDLHDAFEWDDTEAGRKYREDQAGYLLRNIHIIIEREEDTEPIQVRAFVHVPDAEEEGENIWSPLVSCSEAQIAYLMEQAKKELAGWSRRYRHYAELHGHPEMMQMVARVNDILQPA